tara:strand:- start:1556 stop:2860 length:1305 start_codon:yes stop_codon:yes gene_type:complete
MNIIIAVDDPSTFSYLVSQFKERITIVQSPNIVNGLSKKEKIYRYIKLIQSFGIPDEKKYNAIWVKKNLFTKHANYSSIKKIFVLLCSRIHCNFQLFRKILRYITYHITIDSRFTDILKQKKIDKVMLDGLTSVWTNNSYWVSASKHLGINTTTLITNWDHPTTRGYESINAKEYLVWGKSMRDEIIKYHDIEPHKVNIKGSIIFDMYSDSSFILSNNKIKSIYNTIIPDKYVLFLTHSPYYPYNFELIKYIRKQLQDDMALIVRLHPLYLDDFAKSELEKHKKYDKANSNVIYFYPNSSNNSLAADMSYGEIQLSASLVANALVMINCMSTMLLDGLISNKKVINIAFDWRKRISHPMPLSIAEYRLHLSRVINAPGSHLVRTRNELSVQLSDLINQNYESKNSSIIDEIILKECGVIDGSVAINIANHLIKS